MSSAYPEFKGQRALITGGTQGIGKAIAERLARQGAVVYLNYSRNGQAARETFDQFQRAGYAAELCKADLGTAAAVEEMLGRIHQNGPLDLLVCNAAYQEKKKDFFETDRALIQRTLDVNILANFQIIQTSARRMIAAGRKGRMVMCSSGHGKMAFKGTFAYDLSKAALNHFVRCAALGAKTIQADGSLPAQVIADEAGGRRANGVFEAVGLAETVRTAYDLCDFGGTVVLIGNLAKDFSLPLQGVTSNETTLRGSYGFNRTEFEKAVHLSSKKASLLRQLISGSCSLEETPIVMERLARGELKAFKMIIRGRLE